MSSSDKKSPPRKPPETAARAPVPGAGPAGATPTAQLLQRLPISTGPVAHLPQVKAPSLEGLSVTVPAPEDLTQDDVLERFHALARAHAEVRPREEGEPVALGDDVQLDILGYANGHLIPFSVRVGHWMELAPQPMLPGFAEVLAEAEVGDSVEVGLLLPEDYPAEHLRGMPARFLVDIRAAREVRMPDTDSDALLRALGRGATHDAVVASIVDELEAELADLLWVDARDLVLDQVVARADVRLPPGLVEEEVRRRWNQTEGEALARKNFSLEEQQEALDGWLQHPDIRADAERRLKIALVLRAIAERDRLTLDPGKVVEVLEEPSAAFGISPEQLHGSLADPATAAQLRDAAWHLLLVEHVMSHAQVRFEGA